MDLDSLSPSLSLSWLCLVVQQGDLKRLVDSVVMVEFNSWTYEQGQNVSLPLALASSLGLSPRLAEFSRIGGNIPQLKVNEACVELEKGNLKAVLLTGAETGNSTSKVLSGQVQVKDWPKGGGKLERGTHTSQMELDYALSMPSRVYPLIETAVRASKGHTPEQHDKYMGDLFARYSEVPSISPFFLGVLVPPLTSGTPGCLKESPRLVSRSQALGPDYQHTYPE